MARIEIDNSTIMSEDGSVKFGRTGKFYSSSRYIPASFYDDPDDFNRVNHSQWFIYRMVPRRLFRPMNLCARSVLFRPVKEFYVEKYIKMLAPFWYYKKNDVVTTPVHNDSSLFLATTTLLQNGAAMSEHYQQHYQQQHQMEEQQQQVLSEQTVAITFYCLIIQISCILLSFVVIISHAIEEYLSRKNVPPTISGGDLNTNDNLTLVATGGGNIAATTSEQRQQQRQSGDGHVRFFDVHVKIGSTYASSTNVVPPSNY